MKIEKYISGLLYRYQCVTVPGFGAFLTEWQSAQIAEAQNSFIPPRKTISFNANIKTNDGLLANHVALQEKISYENALAKIQAQVLFWSEKLQNKENITLENIGEIHSNSENNWVFTPNSAINYLTDSFGLAGFNSPEIVRENISLEKTVTDNIVPQEIENEVVAIETSIEEEKAETPVVALPNKTNTTNWLKYAAAAIVLVSVGTYGYKMYYDFTINQKTLLVQQAVQEKVNQKLQEATFVLPNPIKAVDLTLEATINPKKYHLIANAFRSRANAEKHQKTLQQQGFSSILFKSKRYELYNVTYGSFSTIEKAEAMKDSLKTTGVTNLWLHID